MAADNTDYLSMSDEDMINAKPAEFTQEPEDTSDEVTAEEPDQETDSGDKGGVDNEADDDSTDEEVERDESPEQVQATEAKPKPPAAPEKAETDAPVADAKKPVADEPAIDYKAAYELLTAPFKANGKDIQVQSVDDALTLMKMGANYNKKMVAMKPHLKILKMLENQQLMSEEKIGFLIDLSKKNPAAISKLVKDSGIDPLSIDADQESAYKPTSYTVDDREIALDTALDEIQDTPTYTQTLEILGNKWDGPSKQTISQNPQLVKVINDHVQSGIYDVITKEVERERMFGRLDGLSDIEAYRQVGDGIQARGGFDNLMQKTVNAPNGSAVLKPKPKSVSDDKLKDKRRAAAPSTRSAPSSSNDDFNPLQLSDEAFNKLVSEKYA